MERGVCNWIDVTLSFIALAKFSAHKLADENSFECSCERFYDRLQAAFAQEILRAACNEVASNCFVSPLRRDPNKFLFLPWTIPKKNIKCIFGILCECFVCHCECNVQLRRSSCIRSTWIPSLAYLRTAQNNGNSCVAERTALPARIEFLVLRFSQLFSAEK